ncbi:MAG: response regulator, partial [Acidobacteria bacterium]|nr:response regulator [Acidobacteriota bacterium]
MSEEKTYNGKKKILVVDDDSRVCKSLRIWFKNEGFCAETANNVSTGLEKFRESNFDLIMIDLRMSEGSGLELAKNIRKEDYAIPIIIMTGFPSYETAAKAFMLGVDDYISKGSSNEKILTTVRRLIEQNTRELLFKRSKEYFFSYQVERIKSLEKVIEELYDAQSSGAKKIKEKIDKYRAICGSVAHSLKGEFLHIGNANKQIREFEGITSDIQEECNIIERSIAFSQILLQRLLDYLDTGMPIMNLLDTRELLKKVEMLVRPRILSNIDFIVSFSEIKSPMVSGNFEQLMGVLLELINNASSALSNKGGTIELKLGEEGDNIAISLKDNGPGIPEKIRKQIFAQQVSSKNGLGLGLFLCNKVVHDLGG